MVTLPIQDDMEEECDQAWLNLQLYMIGGLFTEELNDLICGAVFSIREKHQRISLWCKDNNNIPKLRRIGNILKEICQVPDKYKFGYQVHAKALKHDLDNEFLLRL